MPSVYARGNRLSVAVGKGKDRRCISTEYVVGQEEQALAAATIVEQKIANGELTVADLGPMTVTRYAKRWIRERKARGIASAHDDEVRLERHVLPKIGSMKIADMRPRNVRELVRELGLRCGSGDDQLAPRTVRHIYATMRTMFNDAVAEELLPTTPCVLKRGELPKKIDKDPTWRPTAVFSRDELEVLISDSGFAVMRRA